MKPLAVFLILLAGPVLADPPPKTVTGKVVAIADGDTLTVLDAGKVQHKIRLHGIDCPEKGQAFGTKAKQALSELVFETEVTVPVVDVDRYGRLVGRVKQGQTEVNRQMVADGFAWRFSQYDKTGEYRAAQEEAKAAKRGLWADPEPVPPWGFRAEKRKK